MKMLHHRNFILSLFFLWPVAAVPSCGGASPVVAGDVPPPPPEPERQERAKNADPTPAPPLQERPSIDPGIVVTPPGAPNPESVVTPPAVDPNMPVYPKDAPSAKQPPYPSPPTSPPPGATPKNFQ